MPVKLNVSDHVSSKLFTKAGYKEKLSAYSKQSTLTKTIFSLMYILVLFTTNIASADRRGYVWTYEYMTMPKGKSEVEYYLTHKISDFKNYDDENSWENQIEYEYGLTDRWDMAIYQRWQQTNTSQDDDFEYTGTKLRARYRLGEKGMYPLDTLLYLEYIKPDSSKSSEVMEGKLILAKDFGKYNFAYNQILKVGINDRGGNENEYACGVNYELNPRLKIGFESEGNYTEDEYSFGPTVSWLKEDFWIALGAQRGLNDRTDDFKFRLIIGFPF